MLAGFSLLKKKNSSRNRLEKAFENIFAKDWGCFKFRPICQLKGCLLLYHFNMTNFHQFNSQALARWSQILSTNYLDFFWSTLELAKLRTRTLSLAETEGKMQKKGQIRYPILEAVVILVLLPLLVVKAVSTWVLNLLKVPSLQHSLLL
jgi:hypothetical protein